MAIFMGLCAEKLQDNAKVDESSDGIDEERQ